MNRAWLNYHHLFYFYMIATEGSIARASVKLRLGQPTLSAQLKLLEESLGHELFERHNRKLTLTEAGHIAFDYAKEIFRLGDEMQEALEDRVVPNRIHVQIGALDSVPKSIISHLVQSAYSFGNCIVSILEGKGEELFRELYAHRIDLILSNYPPPVGENQGIYSRSIAKIPVIVCGSTKYKALKKDFPNSLIGYPFVLPTIHSKLRHDLDHFFKVNAIHVEPIAETQDTSVQNLLGISGLGLIPVAELAALDLIKEKKLIPLGALPSIYEEIWLISASRKISNPIAARLMESFQLQLI